jgi:hypothetical protein
MNCRLGGLQLHNLTGLILKVGKDNVLKGKSQAFIAFNYTPTLPHN